MINVKQVVAVLLISIASTSIPTCAQSQPKNTETITKVPVDRSGVNAALKLAIINQAQAESRKQVGNFTCTSERFSVLEADLNGDDRKESIVMFMHGVNCSNRYCRNYIFTHNKNKTKYQLIGEFGSSRGGNLLTSTHNNYDWKDLITPYFNYEPRGFTWNVIRFNGEKYNEVRRDLEIPPNTPMFPKNSDELPLFNLCNLSDSKENNSPVKQ
jgi:hypothetical protein